MLALIRIANQTYLLLALLIVRMKYLLCIIDLILSAFLVLFNRGSLTVDTFLTINKKHLRREVKKAKLTRVILTCELFYGNTFLTQTWASSNLKNYDRQKHHKRIREYVYSEPLSVYHIFLITFLLLYRFSKVLIS